MMNETLADPVGSEVVKKKSVKENGLDNSLLVKGKKRIKKNKYLRKIFGARRVGFWMVTVFNNSG